MNEAKPRPDAQRRALCSTWNMVLAVDSYAQSGVASQSTFHVEHGTRGCTRSNLGSIAGGATGKCLVSVPRGTEETAFARNPAENCSHLNIARVPSGESYDRSDVSRETTCNLTPALLDFAREELFGSNYGGRE